MAPTDWQTIAANKRAAIASQIPASWKLSDSFLGSVNASATTPTQLIATNAVRASGVLSEQEWALTEEGTATELVQKMSKGEVKAEGVVTAFCKRACVAGQLVSVFDFCCSRGRRREGNEKKKGGSKYTCLWSEERYQLIWGACDCSQRQHN